MRSTARTLGMLGLLQLALPLNAAVTAVALATTRAPQQPRLQASEKKTVMISGGKMTKALQLARSFHDAGHRVVLVEESRYRFTGHRFSRAVDVFRTVPKPTAPDYAEGLLQVAQEEGVDVYVPVCSPVSSLADARAKKLLEQVCEVVHPEADEVEMLDNKYRFGRTAAGLGLDVPRAHLVTDPAEVAGLLGDDATWVLKSIAYDPVGRRDLRRLPLATPAETDAYVRSLPIRDDNPWILQEFVAGQEYCTHGTVRDGRLTVHCCCRSSAFQLNYEHVDVPQIEEWVRTFVGALGLTGQVSLDVIATDDGRFLPIECNPRTHSAITMFYDEPRLADAYLRDGGPTLQPTPSSRPTYWLYWEAWQALRRPSSAREHWSVVRAGKDAIFDRADPLPFFLTHHLQIPFLLLRELRERKGWVVIDVNIGKLVQPAGE